MEAEPPRSKEWQYPRLISEHAFDKLRLIDCTFAEFDAALAAGEIIDVEQLEPGVNKELVLITGWQRPLHLVVVADQHRHEERIITVYEPDPEHWSDDYRRRRR